MANRKDSTCGVSMNLTGTGGKAEGDAEAEIQPSEGGDGRDGEQEKEAGGSNGSGERRSPQASCNRTRFFTAEAAQQTEPNDYSRARNYTSAKYIVSLCFADLLYLALLYQRSSSAFRIDDGSSRSVWSFGHHPRFVVLLDH